MTNGTSFRRCKNSVINTTEHSRHSNKYFSWLIYRRFNHWYFGTNIYKGFTKMIKPGNFQIINALFIARWILQKKLWERLFSSGIFLIYPNLSHGYRFWKLLLNHKSTFGNNQRRMKYGTNPFQYHLKIFFQKYGTDTCSSLVTYITNFWFFLKAFCDW